MFAFLLKVASVPVNYRSRTEGETCDGMFSASSSFLFLHGDAWLV